MYAMLKPDGMGPQIPIAEVMDVRNDYLCYNLKFWRYFAKYCVIDIKLKLPSEVYR